MDNSPNGDKKLIKLLIVDDDEVDRIKYRRLLMDAEYNTFDVVEVDSAEKATQIINKITPDCILLDYHLPGLNGLEFLKLINDQHPEFKNIPIVMLTGEHNSKIISAAIQFQIGDYLIKPTVDKYILEKSVSSAIRRSLIKRDIEKKQKQIESMYSQLKKEKEKILEFIGNVSHELMTPVASINLFVQALLDKGQSHFQSGELEYLGYISDNCHQLKTYVDDLLDESRLFNGKVKLDLEKNSISRLIDKIKKEHESKIHDKGLKFEVSIETDVDEFKFDKDRVYQIISNLLNNSVKFTDKGKIKLSLYTSKNDPKFLYCAVEDTGCGIPKDKLPFIFNRLYQVHSGDYGGLGLGLTIVSQLVKLHGGSIEVKSTVDKGSQFTFKLPIS